MSKIQNIQGLRGIAVLFVLMVHIGLVEKKYSAYPILPEFVQFGMSGVDIFFVISGFIMMTLSMHRTKNVNNAISFLYSRVVRVYPIYWFYSGVVLLVLLVHPSWVNSSSSGEIDLLKSFLLFPQSVAPLLQVGWTLIHEMYFYIGFFLLLLFFRSNSALFLVSMLWAISVIFLESMFSFTDPVMQIVTHPLTLEFFGGIIIAYVGLKIDLKCSTMLLKNLFLLLLLLLIFNYILFDNIYATDPFRWWRVVLFGLPAMALLFVSIQLEKKGYTFPLWLVVIGDRSYTVYLSHLLVINVVGRIWQYFSFEGFWASVMFLLVLVISTLLYGKYAYEWIEVPMLEKLRALLRVKKRSI